jgi:hypothetical protein
MSGRLHTDRSDAHLISRSTLYRVYLMAAFVLIAKVASAWVLAFLAARHDPLLFDDAYMFMRYAHNVQHGLGYSWNPDGVHTYGPTSLLWAFVTFVLSFLPTGSWTQLLIGSGLCSIGAAVAMAWAVSANARTSFMRRLVYVLPLVVVPLAGSAVFENNQFNGMETMLGMTLCAVFLGLALRWREGRAHPAAVGAAALLLLLARPESGLVGLLVPVLLWWFIQGERPALGSLLAVYGVFLGGAAIELSACKLYFGTPVPLSVYLKGKAAYEGYSGIWHPELLLVMFLNGCQAFLITLVLLLRRTDWRLLLCCLLPAVAVFGYLQTVTQIMGFNARYFAPYIPLVVIPALLLLDRRLADGDWLPTHLQRMRGAVAVVTVGLLVLLSSAAVQSKIRHFEHKTRTEYVEAQLTVDATQTLPKTSWQEMMMSITNDLLVPLPAGGTYAASEVGYLGERVPHATVIDLAGLNDMNIARHGFHMDDLLRRKPDLIWMPHSDYTYLRGVMLSDPDLLAAYDVYAGAGNYGIALRKDSPMRPAIDRQMAIFWQKTYPGYQQSQYLVHAASWTGAKRIFFGE